MGCFQYLSALGVILSNLHGQPIDVLEASSKSSLLTGDTLRPRQSLTGTVWHQIT